MNKLINSIRYNADGFRRSMIFQHKFRRLVRKCAEWFEFHFAISKTWSVGIHKCGIHTVVRLGRFRVFY